MQKMALEALFAALTKKTNTQQILQFLFIKRPLSEGQLSYNRDLMGPSMNSKSKSTP